MISVSGDKLIVIYIITHVVPLARFRDAAYHVFEGERVFSVVIEKIGSSSEEFTVFVRYHPGTATIRK